jgi:colicin import membrane protein
MKRTLVALIGCACLLAQAAEPAQVVDGASAFPTQEAREQERVRLDAARQELEAQYNAALKQCYQQFDVTSCRLKARDRRIEANQALRKEELNFNAVERHVKFEDAKRRLEERNSEASRKDAEAQRAQAIAAAKERADANSQKQIDHALQGTKRGEYEQKQRDAAQHRADVEKKLRERTKEPAAPLPLPTR